MDFKHWYAIHVITGQESSTSRRIETELRKHDSFTAQIFLPRVQLFEFHNKVRVPVTKIMFPGYLLIGTDAIEQVYDAIRNCKGVLKFLRSDDYEFQELRPDEIARLAYMSDDSGLVGVSSVTLDENARIVVLAGPLKGMDGYITKYDRRRGRVAVDFLLGSAHHTITMSVRVVAPDASK
jgi:transcriptional antiterminator NusG